MSKKLHTLVLFGILCLILAPFTNCGTYSSDTTPSTTSSLSCTTSNCVTPTVSNLKITPNLFNGAYSIAANISEFNIGGDCNEGGFPVNKIHWELVLNGSVVRNSSQPVNSGSNAETKCVNGRFMVYVYLGPVTGYDSTDRTGLSIGGTTRTAYTLNVKIYGQTSASDPGVPVTSSVQLNAI